MNTPRWLSAAVETACNRYLALDPRSLEHLAALQGRVIALQVSGPELTLYFLPGPEGVQVLGHYEGVPDTRLRGTPLALARLGARSDTGAVIGGAVTIEGDTDAGQRFKEALSGVELDWEEWLARLTGDVAAHQLGSGARRAGDYLRRSAGTLADDMGEYLQEEARVLPTRVEVENFLDDVDRLRADHDRLAARVGRLQAALERGKGRT